MEHSFVVALFIIFLAQIRVNKGAEQDYKLFVDSDEIDLNFYSSEDSFATISDDVKDLIASPESVFGYDQSSVNPANLVEFKKVFGYDQSSINPANLVEFKEGKGRGISQNIYAGNTNFGNQNIEIYGYGNGGYGGKCRLKGSVRIGGRCYWLSQETTTWYEAKDKCCQVHPKAYLAQFETHQETVAVLCYLTERFSLDRYWWLGGNDFERRNDFRWIIGKGNVVNEDWCSDEPNLDGTQHCVHVDVNDVNSRFCLGNYDCDVTKYKQFNFYYICEIDAN